MRTYAAKAAKAGALDGALDEADLHEAVVKASQQQEQGHQKCTNVNDVHAAFLRRDLQSPAGDANPDAKDDEPEDEEDDGPGSGKLGPHTRHLPAVRTPGEGVVESVEQEGVVAVSARHTAHPRYIRCGRDGGLARCQVNDPLAVGPGAGDPLRGALADEETVAGATHVLPPWRGVPDGRGLVALAALHHVLVFFAGDVDHVLADATGDHWNAICH